MKDVTFAQPDWRNSLSALIGINATSVLFGQQFPRTFVLPISRDACAESALRSAAAAGNAVAMEQLGIWLIQGECATAAPGDGIAWLRHSADEGNPVAMYWLAEELLFTDAHDSSSEAQRLLERAAASDFLPAQVALGTHLLNGTLPLNVQLALELLRSAAQRGSRLAHIALAAAFLSGWGVPVDFDAGGGWLRRLGATRPRLVGALAANLYSKALGLRTMERRRLTLFAASLFDESIRQGNLDDQVNLAYLVRRGEVTGGHLPSLNSLLEPHLAAGEPHALMNQALHLARGVGSEVAWRAADALVASVENSGSVVAWWQSRAVEGDPEGHLVLGWLVRHRRSKDPERVSTTTRFDAARTGDWRVPDWMYVEPALG